jgi:polygalacturonase
VHIKHSKNILVENLLFKDSPYWTFYAEDSDGLVIRYSDVDARWTDKDEHTALDLQAFNTDGFDVTGKNVHIHDANIWNQGIYEIRHISHHTLSLSLSLSFYLQPHPEP